MKALEISNQDLSRLADEAMDLATTYWASLDDRPAYPSTSGRETTELFSRPWAEEGRGRDVLHDFK
ncbi:MAG: pyridoxal-dependent decarboxylase, partial [Mesorhizobium sp.]